MQSEAERQAKLERRVRDLVASDAQIRAAVPDEELTEVLRGRDIPLAQTVATIMTGYADRPALGQRAVELITDDDGRRRARVLPRFDTLTYRELWQRVGAVASVWHRDAEHPVRAGDIVATLGFTSIDYTTVDLACTYMGMVSVPLQAGSALAQLTSIVAETGPRVIAADAEQLNAAVDLVLASDTVRRLVVFDFHAEDDDHRAALDAAQGRLTETLVRVETLASVLARGRELPPAPLHTTPDPDALALLLYTSGSTGSPKGAMYSHRLVADIWRRRSGPALPMVGLSYTPMSHIVGRQSMIMSLALGGTVYFAARSDMSTLLEDIALVRPTLLFFVPRVCDMVFQRFQSETDRRVTAGGDRARVEQDVKAELRENFLGGRFLLALVVSAPLSAGMREFMESVLGTELIDGYGATETAGGMMMDNRLQRPPILDYKLIDVPELGYFVSDKPYPRGELLIKSQALISGYYKRPELNAEIFDADGFYRTGDVMAELEPDRLVYIDRRNNVLKLSQGEFVAVAKLEAVYAGSPLIRQIYVYGSSERAYLLAVIVPTVDAVAAYPDRADLKAAINESLRQVAKAAELSSVEIPRDFLLEIDPFTIDDGLLSGIGKLLRPKVKARYGQRLEELYGQLELEQADELLTLRRAAQDLPVLDVVRRAVRALLGPAESELHSDAHFTDFGGDSLSALSFSTLLRETFGVEVSVGVIVSSANTLAVLAEYIEAERNSTRKRPTPESVHGTNADIHAADLSLEKFIDETTLAAAGELPPTAQPPRTVLLTGANGYLGRFLCLEWLQRLSEQGAKLICLVRGRDTADAQRRLDEVFDSGDPELLHHYRALAEGTLEVLAGDIGEPNLGLSESDWRRLAASVDMVVHPAALVNHVLPYEQLFGPNVVGTAEVIRLALTARLKPITYLSTVSVKDQIDPAVFAEDGDIRAMSAVRRLGDGYANGYGNSKWAGEVLLRQAHDLCGLPVTVFRSDMILAHSRFAGQLNVADMFTRLLLSLLATGVAPKSFYETDIDGNRQRAHYDGLPADFTAQAITALGGRATSGFETFDVRNAHDDDGISLDELIDWLIESGCRIDRIDDYDEWFSRFETALRALPEQQRKHSVLPLLHAYRQPGSPSRGVVPVGKFQAAVRAGHLGVDNDIPHLTPALVAKYVSDLEMRKLL
ncbi:carboxylic acid reductase [Nocardia sp. NPDC050630]|uniref:carboxylic acid reductase n=1 Tax=Nocardia sp. NPDC050630 TaxID=3364321 RepID=UPI0037BCB73E